MTGKRQILATLLSVLCLTSLPVQARLFDPVLGPRAHQALEARLTAELRGEARRLFASLPRVAAFDPALEFRWGFGAGFVTDLQRGVVVIEVPRDVPTDLRPMRAAFVHQLGLLIYAAAGGGGDPALAELFADVLTVVHVNDPGAVTRAFSVDGRPASIEGSRFRAFDPRPRALTEFEWRRPAYRLNLVKAEIARRSEWARVGAEPAARAAYLERVLAALVRTSHVDFGPATEASALRMTHEVLKSLGYR